MAEKFTSYGLRGMYGAPLLSDTEAGAIYAEDLTRFWGAQESSITVAVSENSLRGDDGVIELDSTVSNVEFSASNAVITLEQLQTILGGTVADILGEAGDGETEPIIGKRYTLSGGQNLPYFGLIGITEKNGSLKIVLPKAKATGGIELSFSDEEYAIVSFSGSGVMREYDGKMFELLKYDATNPVVVADLN